MAAGEHHLLRGVRGTLNALLYSWQGLKATWRHEVSFRTEVCVFLLAAPLALWLGKSCMERALLLGSCLLVLAAELINSAIESVIERYGNAPHALAGRAKDMGSAAVFVLIVNVVAVWALVLWPRFQ